MKALVTGGTGLVGKPLVRRLLEEGWHVALLTRDRERARHLDGDNLAVYEGDVSDGEATGRIARGEQRFDAVFHLAASLDYFGDRKELHRTNVQGTHNVLSLAIGTRAQKVVYASSIEAAGPVTKNTIPAAAAARMFSNSVRAGLHLRPWLTTRRSHPGGLSRP